MDQQTYQLRLENLQLKLQQAPNQTNMLQYLEARIQLLEQYVFNSTPSQNATGPAAR